MLNKYSSQDISIKLELQEIHLSGWVHKRRDHGGIIFIDLRDHKGLIQLVFDQTQNFEMYQLAETLRNEYVIEIKGQVVKRSQETVNTNLQTGELEILVKYLNILNTSKPLPFSISEHDGTGEETRFKYRFLDLRKEKSRQPFFTRYQIVKTIRQFLDTQEFIELETPILTKATPEGARDFLVPSRIHPGEFYALPQSPQLFKQLFMMSGFYRYFQIARCFRDEDLRADRQPEFTQLDMELSFVDREDIIDLIQQMFQHMLKTVYNINITLPIQKMTYHEAMTQYGTDRPDIRFDMKLVNIESIARDSQFSVFTDSLKNGGIVYGLNVKKGASFSRKQIEHYTKYVEQFGAKGLAFMKVTQEGLESNITKFFTSEQLSELKTVMKGEEGDLFFFVADHKETTFQSLGNLRILLAQDLNLIQDSSELKFLWIVDFPLFEYSKEEKRYVSTHHPFTSPNPEDLKYLENKEFDKVRAQAYDLVLNGIELGGGSVRIHNSELQKQIFEILNLSEEDINIKFGFFIEALQYGTPPHAGIAFGLDRVVMLLEKLNSIRDVIAFPKTQKGQCLLTSSPSKVTTEQLKEVHIQVNNKV